MTDPSLQETIASLEKASSQAMRAVQETADNATEVQALRDLFHRTKKLRWAAGRPPCLGIFGPSQAGKSFLVGAMLSHELGNLTVLTKGRELDFLKEINPAKGVESTGVVTRFSTRELPRELTQGDFLCRLLSLEVLLESIATGFLVECTSPAVDGDRVAKCLRDARLAEGPAAPARYREAWETVWHNLVKKYQSRHPYLNDLRRQPALQSPDWRDGIKSAAGWGIVFSLLWGGPGYAPDVDNLMARLIEGLESVGHAELVEVTLDNVRASSEGASVVDAACLNSVGSNRTPVSIFTDGGKEVSIAPGVLSALIAELHLQFRAATGSLLERADILDFPGGRALKGINGFGPEELNTGRLDNAVEVFKRGKLTFLFEQFSVDREISALCLCSPGPTKPEAIQLQSQVEAWLKIRFGQKTPTHPHEVDKPSLFMALTKFDMSLGALRSDNAKDRWDSRVQEACVDFWARSQTSWIVNWGGRGRAFDNMFWIRNPYADQMRTLEPGQADFEEVKGGYLESRAVQRHIRNAEDKWRAVEGDDESGMPKSGIPLLCTHLRDKLAENVKAKEVRAEATMILSELRTLLKAMTPSRDEEEERERIREHAELLVRAIEHEMSRRCSGAVFGELIGLATVDAAALEHEVRNIHASVSRMSIKTSDKVKKVVVHLLKWWMAHASGRVRDSELGLPTTLVDGFVREVCTAKKLLPVLGRALYPHFSRTTIDTALVANIVRVTVSDAMLSLFEPTARRTPEGPVRLSYSEVLGEGETEEGANIDWGDVSFEDDEPADEVGDVEIVFAGARGFSRWSDQLGDFYLENRGARPQVEKEDPRSKVLVLVLKEVEGIHVGAAT